MATTKLKSAEALPDVWKDGIESAEFKALIDAKQRSSTSPVTWAFRYWPGSAAAYSE